MKLDYTERDPDERMRVVRESLAEDPSPTRAQLTYMADYLLFTADPAQTAKEKRSEAPIITKNRDVTVSKRQISYEETVSSLQNGEDGIYALIVNDKDAILDPREPLSERDKEEVPGLAENLAVIGSLKRQLESAVGRRKYLIKRQIISKYQECYTMKSSYLGIPAKPKATPQVRALAHVPLPEEVELGEDGVPRAPNAPVTLMDESHVLFLLRHYSALKQEVYADFDSDMYYLLLDLERVVDEALAQYPMYMDLLVMEVDGYPGEEIAATICGKYKVRHSIQYFSTLWCSKIPKMVALQAQKDWLTWHYIEEDPEHAKWKICRSCGQVKLAHPYFFSKNTSKDGFYSRCRECRSTKVRKEGGYGKRLG